MLLNKLTIQGFKSFANSTILSFDQGITAIVGPNGVGKSNIVDAIRWVLGEQSKKDLRGKRGEDIIFAGSASKKRLGLAEVSLTLHNESLRPKDNLSFSEISLKRRFYRDGEGEYFLNQSQVRLKDIEGFLACANIGQENYAIIGQGMIDKIISLAPEEKRELFLEASGAKPLELKLREAEQKLQTTQMNLDRVYDLTREIKPHLDLLRRQARKASRGEKIIQKLKALQETWYWLKLEASKKVQTRFNSQKQKAAAFVKAQEAEIENLREVIGGVEKQRKENQKIWRTLEGEEAALFKTQQEIQKNIALQEGYLEAKLQNSLSKIKREIAELEKEIQYVNSKIQKLKGQYQISLKILKKKQKELDALREEKERREKSEKIPISFVAIRVSLEELLKTHKGLLQDFQKSGDPALLKEKIANICLRLRHLLFRLKARENLRENQSDFKKSAGLAPEVWEKEKEIREINASLSFAAQKIKFLNYQKASFQKRIILLEKKLHLAPQNKRETGKEERKLNLLQIEFHKKEAEIAKRRKKIEELSKTEREDREKIFRLDRALRQKEDEKKNLRQTQTQLEREARESLLQKQELQKEIQKELGKSWRKINPNPSFGALPEESKLAAKIDRLKHALEISSSIDPEIIREYEETQKRFDFLTREATDLEKASGTLTSLIQKLDRTIQAKFDLSFKRINASFKKYFCQIFGGGESSLYLDSEKNISLFASPPGKRLMSIEMLSGGEKSLVGLCLVFSIISYNPPPFCVLDEVDAALDEVNSRRFASILKALARKTQIITITHNRETMKITPALYGVTMGKDGVSKLLSMKLEK